MFGVIVGVSVFMIIVGCVFDLIFGLPIYTVIEDTRVDSDKRFLLRKGIIGIWYVDMSANRYTWTIESNCFKDCYGTRADVITRYNKLTGRTKVHNFRKLSQSELTQINENPPIS